MKKLLLILFTAVALSGCGLFDNTAEVNVARLETELTAERAARAKEDAARKVKADADAARHGTASAYTIAADEATDHIPDLPETKLPKTAVKSDLKVAIKSQDAADPAALAEARKMNQLYFQGKAAEAEELLAQALDRATEAERKSAGAEALVAKASADVTRVTANTDAALTKTKADAEAAIAAKDAELDRKLKEKDANQARELALERDKTAQAKLEGPLIAAMKASADLRELAFWVTGITILSAVVTAILKGNATAVIITGVLGGAAASLYTFSIGVMDPKMRVIAFVLTGVTSLAGAGGVAYSIYTSKKKSKQLNEHETTAHTFDELIPALAEGFKLLDPTGQKMLTDAVATSLGNTAKAVLVGRLTSLGYGTPETWVPTATKAAAPATPVS